MNSLKNLLRSCGVSVVDLRVKTQVVNNFLGVVGETTTEKLETTITLPQKWFQKALKSLYLSVIFQILLRKTCPRTLA